MYCLVLSFDLQTGLPDDEWYTTPVRFGDWRGAKECDYVTNTPVYEWYTGKKAGAFRPPLSMDFRQRLAAGETLSIGLDYYAMNIASALITESVGRRYGRYLWYGGVVVVESVGNDSILTYILE